jgi:mannose-6-phosphate isomerase
MSSGSKPRRIEPEFHAKIWGSPRIEPWFDARGDELTGEVWFPAGDLLIKFLFTSQDLSVQVHPGDEYALAHANSPGKTEMWHILRAEPGARIALGFRRRVSASELVAGAQSGQILDWLNWVKVQPGDTYLIPAGAVHAIGAGIALCEIQQNSDVTYRLYDYGRDRPLHLQHAMEVTDLEMRPEKLIPRDIGNGLQLLVECPYFRTYLVTFNWNHDPRPRTCGGYPGTRLLIVLEGSARVNGLTVSAGQVLAAQVRNGSSSHEWVIEPENVTSPGSMQFLLTG